MKKIRENIGVAFVLLTVIVGALAWYSGVGMHVVLSGSMEPAVHTGAVIVAVPQHIYEVGDVVIFYTSQKANMPTTHRIVDISVRQGMPAFITRGDANNSNDFTLVSPEHIMGQVLFSVPYIGFVFSFARQPLGFMLLAGIPTLLIMIQETQKIIAEVRKKKVAITESNTTKAI